MRLHETTNVISFVYGDCQSTPAASVQVGLRGSTPNDWTNRTGTWAGSTAGAANTAALAIGPGSVPVRGLTYTFTPPAPQPCPVPFSLSAGPAGTQAALSWRAAAPSAGPYRVEWGLRGFAPGNGLGSLTAPGPNATLAGLQPSTDYDYYVTQLCGGAAGTSPVSGPPGRFRTTILNDEAVDATALPVAATCQPVSGTLVGATRSAGNGWDPLLGCNGTSPSTSNADVWYAVTTAATGPASTALQFAATGAAASVRVFASTGGAAGPFRPLYCDLSRNPPQPFDPFVLTALAPSTTYYVQIINPNRNGGLGPFTLCATVPAPCGDPTNPNGNTNVLPTQCDVTFQPGSGAQSYLVTVTPELGGPTQSFTFSGLPPFTLTGLPPATRFNATLQAICTNGGLSAVVPFRAFTRPTNDQPTAALPLTIGPACQPTAGNTTGATVVLPTLNPPTTTGCGERNPHDVWYRFVTPLSGPGSTGVRVQVTGVGAQQVRVFANASGGGLVQVACSGTSSTAPAPLLDILNRLTPGTTYFVQVGIFSRTSLLQGPFTICLTAPPTCAAPPNPTVAGITATGATLTPAPLVPAPAGGYVLTVSPQGGAGTAQPFASGPQPVSGLQPGTYYTAAVQANCGGNDLSLPGTVGFRTPGPPNNDLCANAVTVRCGDGPVTGMLTGATTTGDPTTACAGQAPLGPGVWYRMAGTGQDVTLSFCTGFADDPDLQVLAYTGTCGNLQCVGSNDTGTACSRFPSYLPALTFATAAGQDYYILVVNTGRRPASQISGEFDLYVNCAAPTVCPTPTGLVLSRIASSSAQITWTALANATNYQVVWQPLGTPNAPPLVVASFVPTATATGLLPNTAYLVTVSATCATGRERSVGTTAQFSTPLGARNPALAAQIDVFPNPARLRAALRVPAALRSVPVPVVLYNAIGQVVRQTMLPVGSAADVELDLVGLPKGRYLLRLTTAPGVIVKSLMVE